MIWKIEDEIESSQGTGRWKSLAERIKERKKEGRSRFKKAWKGMDATEEISYLTVECDFQEVPTLLPKRIRARSEDRGFYFVTDQKEPILGPKTQEEVEEEVKMKQGMAEHMTFREAHRTKVTSYIKGKGRKEWTPRWEDIQIDEEDRIPVKVQFLMEENQFEYEWDLRKDL
jgi:hypothetical protein